MECVCQRRLCAAVMRMVETKECIRRSKWVRLDKGFGRLYKDVYTKENEYRVEGDIGEG